MSTNQRHAMRLREKLVVTDESDLFELKPRMTDHLRVSKLTGSTKLSGERDSGRGAEYVEDGSVAMRSGTVEYSKNHPMFGLGFGPKKTENPIGNHLVSGLKPSEALSLPNRPSKDTNKFYKKAKQNSSELAEPRRLATACFGLVRKQQTESYTTQVVDSYPEVEDLLAQATRETRLNAS